MFLVLSNSGAIVETLLEPETADRRARALGGLIVPLTATEDFRAGERERRETRAAPFRPIPDVR